MPKYALVVIDNGGDVMSFSSEIASSLKKDEDIYEEVRVTHNLDHDEIVDIVVIESESTIYFNQLNLNKL